MENSLTWTILGSSLANFGEMAAVGGLKLETALFSDAHLLQAASNGKITESSPECCSLNKCNSFIIIELLLLSCCSSNR
jgi:hypothetical protein